VSQSNTDQSQAAETPTQETRTFIRQVRSATRRKYAPEDKIRIVLEGFRREVTVSDICRREGIKPGVFYAWTKEFMEAGKERLTRDTVRDATRQESETTGCRPFPGGPLLQKNGHPDFGRGHRRMSAQERSKVITRVEQTRWGKRRLLAQLQVPRSIYYRWRARERQGEQECPAASTRRIPWNRLSSPEEATVLAAARESPEWSSRQLAT